MKWLVWGTGAGVLPFFLFYAVPFALGSEPRLATELAGFIPLALIPLSLAYAVVKHRLMDVELLFRRTLALHAGHRGHHRHLPGGGERRAAHGRRRAARHRHRRAVRAAGGRALPAREEPRAGGHRPALLPRALLLPQGAAAALAGPERRPGPGRAWRSACWREWAPRWASSRSPCSCPTAAARSAVFKSLGFEAGAETLRLPAAGALLARLSAGEPVNAERSLDLPGGGPPEPQPLLPLPRQGRGHRHPGRRTQGGPGPAEQRGDRPAAGAGRPDRDRVHERTPLRQPAGEGGPAAGAQGVQREHPGVDRLRHPGAGPERLRRALEPGHGDALRPAARGRRSGGTLDEIFPESFMEALRGSLVLGRHEEIANIYKLHLPTPDGRSPHGQRLGGALPARRRAARDHPDRRRRDRAHAAGGAAPALREDGVDRPAGRGRGARGEHAPRRHLLLHAAPAGRGGGRRSQGRPAARRSRSRASARPRSSTTC